MVKTVLLNYRVWGKQPQGLSLKEYPIPISREEPTLLPIPYLANIFNFSLEMPIVGFKTYLLELLKFSNPNPTPMNGENVSSKK